MDIFKENFKPCYEFIYKYFQDTAKERGSRPSTVGFREYLNISAGKWGAWTKGQWPSAEDLKKLHALFGFSYRWLVTGEGEPWEKEIIIQQEPAQARLQEAEPAVQSVPVVGFASCGIQGWGGKMTFPLAVSAPHSRPNMIAVMATGESMIPEGIGHGHICFCDPHLTPLAGECVYVESIDGKAALKAFVGRGVDAGHNTKEHEICLRGWLDKQGAMPQKDFYLRIPTEMVQILAPVVYVQRRL